MLCDDSDRIEVRFVDRVRVRRDGQRRIRREDALSFGDWYVNVCSGPDCIDDPDTNFDVGHHPTGLRIGRPLGGGFTFWEARRIALAMEDASVAIDRKLDPDIPWIAEAIVASALMDHYVFPLANYLDLS